MSANNNQRPYQDKIETAFDMLVSAQVVVKHVLTKAEDGGYISARDLLRIAAGPKNAYDQDLLVRICKDLHARRQFRSILENQAIVSQQQQAAASSLASTQRQRFGKDFDLKLIPSSKNDGLFYLQLTVTGDVEIARLSKAEVLFAESNGAFLSLPLPKIINNMVQLMVNQDHPMVNAFHDPEAEFFIR